MAVIAPTDVSNLVGWFKAGADVYTDAAKTTPCTATGDLVYTWGNQVGGVGDLVQATSGKRPAYSAVGELTPSPSVRSSATGERAMIWTNPGYALPYSCVIAMKWGGLHDTYNCLWWTPGANDTQCTFHSSSGSPYLWGGASSAASTVNMSTTALSVLGTTHNGTSSKIRLNGAYTYSGSTNIGTATLLTNDVHFFGDNNLNYTGKFDLYEVLIYDKALSTQEFSDLENYLNYTHLIRPNSETIARRSGTGSACVNGAIKKVGQLGGPLSVGVRKDTGEGDPSTPCLAIDIPNSYRFRWGVTSGTRTISVKAKQVSNVSGKRPRLVVKANPEIGVDSDVIEEAGAGAGWVTIGPAEVTPDADGVLWVELHNMDTDNFNSPAFFDSLSTT